MGKYTRITCDVCGKDIYGTDYFTVRIRKVTQGKQIAVPTIWVCREDMLKTHLLFVDPHKENEND